MAIDKRQLIDRIIELVEQELAALARAAKASHEAATHEENRAEDKHDTRGLEASYLAGAQAARVAELEALLALYRGLPIRAFAPGDAIGAGALVEVDCGGRRSHYFLIGQGGGISVKLEGNRSVQVITPQAPLGDALLGSRVGDGIEVESQGVMREYEIIAIS